MSEANEYELLYVVHARKPVDEVPAVIEWVSGLVTEAGGEVLSVDDWGRRRLAYPIDHELEGSYVLTTLTLPPEGPRGVEAQLVISEDIIRHLLTRGIIPSDRDLSVDESAPAVAATEPAVATEPVTAGPAATEPVAAEPVATEPVTAEAAESEPVTAEPAASEPAAAEPAASEPATSPAEAETVTTAEAETAPDGAPEPTPATSGAE